MKRLIDYCLTSIEQYCS